ncbi:MAG: cytochrome bc complex cytochrome b subunit [Planctomycetes bacterium]|nr:cytochrome bc complex cytochrome b subunit [Planctomycetota bacterium]
MKLLRIVDEWLAERLPMNDVKGFIRAQASKALPPHTSWFHTFGSLSLFLVVSQIVTGILLMVYYRATPETAFESVRYITAKADFGWLIRGLHAWGATLMLLMVLLHMMRTFFMGAFKKPREGTWVIGVFLFGLTLTFGFTGYLLPWNQLSYWATTIGTEMTGSIPIVGAPIKHLLLGGDAVSGETLARFYVMHVAVLPWILMMLVTVHLVLMRVQGLATLDPVGQESPADQKAGIPFFPHHVLKELMVFSVFLGAMITLVILWPTELGEKANPLETPAAIKPEWYFLPTYQLLKFFPKLLGLVIAFVPPLVLLVWPFLDRTPQRRLRRRPVSGTIGVVALILAVVLGLMGALAEQEVTIFGKKVHVDHYGIPHSIPRP